MTLWIGCSYDNCDRPHRARGYCNGHLEQQRRGKPMTPLRTLPKFAWTYVVYWPDAVRPGVGVLKVGRCWSRSRLKGFLDRGARLVSNTGRTDETWEVWALRFLALEYAPAFTCAEEAEDLMWRGRGWTECFVVEESELYEAMDLVVYGYSYGNERGTNDPSAYRRPPFEDDQESEPHATPDSAIPDEISEEAPPVTKVTPGARVTARALWLMTDETGCRRIDVAGLARKIYPHDDPAAAQDAITLHILELEEQGALSTYADAGGEWVQFARPMSDLPGPAPAAFTRQDSTASGGESERARERARESVRAERARADRAWGILRDHQASTATAARPARPASIDAPPLGCPEHPNGSLFPCGPCGTARRQYDAFMDAQRYENKLADFEFWHGDEEVLNDDKPF